MPALIIDNCVQVRLLWNYNGAPTAVNVITAIKEATFTGVDQTSTNGIGTNITNALTALSATDKQNWNSNWKLASVGVRDINVANEPEFLYQPATPFAGGNPAEVLPLNVAACVTLRTDKAGASYRGRMYVSGWTEGASTAGNMATVAVTAATNLVTAVRDGLDASALQMAVGSRKLGQARQVQSIVCRDSTWDTQRRRIRPGI